MSHDHCLHVSEIESAISENSLTISEEINEVIEIIREARQLLNQLSRKYISVNSVQVDHLTVSS